MASESATLYFSSWSASPFETCGTTPFREGRLLEDACQRILEELGYIIILPRERMTGIGVLKRNPSSGKNAKCKPDFENCGLAVECKNRKPDCYISPSQLKRDFESRFIRSESIFKFVIIPRLSDENKQRLSEKGILTLEIAEKYTLGNTAVESNIREQIRNAVECTCRALAVLYAINRTRKRKKYSAETKRWAVRKKLVDGWSTARIRAETGIPSSTLHNWLAKKRDAQTKKCTIANLSLSAVKTECVATDA